MQSGFTSMQSLGFVRQEASGLELSEDDFNLKFLSHLILSHLK